MKLGQHFLCNEEILKKIAINFENEKVIEIGPGKGALTKYLLQNNTVIAFEIDPNLCFYLKKEFPQLEVYNKDIRYVSLENVQNLVGNIPYYITKPLFKKILENNTLKKCILLIQKEVAELLTSPKLNKLKLKVKNQYLVYFEQIVSKTFFKPKPLVDGAIIKLLKKDKEYSDLFIDKIWFLFNYKRKTINKILKISKCYLKITEDIGLKRPENLTNEDLNKLYFLNISP